MAERERRIRPACHIPRPLSTVTASWADVCIGFSSAKAAQGESNVLGCRLEHSQQCYIKEADKYFMQSWSCNIYYCYMFFRLLVGGADFLSVKAYIQVTRCIVHYYLL